MRFLLYLAAVFSFNPHALADTQVFQRDIDSAISEIMLTKTGQAICSLILGGQAQAIEFHLGVSAHAAESIAENCMVSGSHAWIAPTSSQDLRKLTVRSFSARKYTLISADKEFPIESWTDPFSNTTVLLVGREGVSHERLVQLLAHEMAVYFDSKANPADAEAKNVPQLKNLELETASGYDPLVALTDPMIAHNLTFIRALQVEYSIVEELIQMGKIVAPADHSDAYLKFLVSDTCKQNCLSTLIHNMKPTFMPLALPLVAFAPHYRSLVGKELQAVHQDWNQGHWHRVQEALNSLPVEFLSRQFTGNPIADLQRVFISEKTSDFEFVSRFMEDVMWPLEWASLASTQVKGGPPLIEFMKSPLLSGYNILLSNGPRVRVRPGNIE